MPLSTPEAAQRALWDGEKPRDHGHAALCLGRLKTIAFRGRDGNTKFMSQNLSRQASTQRHIQAYFLRDSGEPGETTGMQIKGGYGRPCTGKPWNPGELARKKSTQKIWGKTKYLSQANSVIQFDRYFVNICSFLTRRVRCGRGYKANLSWTCPQCAHQVPELLLGGRAER